MKQVLEFNYHLFLFLAKFYNFYKLQFSISLFLISYSRPNCVSFQLQIVIITEGSVPTSNLSKTLKFLVKTRTYLDWKNDQENFWSRLRLSIARTTQNNQK